MTRSISFTPVWYRIIALVVGIVWFLWLSYEDASERWVLVFSVAISVLAATRLSNYYLAQGLKNQDEDAQNEDQHSRKRFLFYILVGTLSGFAVTPVAILLMALKSGLHGHLIPEYTSYQVFTVLQRTPIWIVGGLLMGVGVGLLRWNRKTK